MMIILWTNDSNGLVYTSFVWYELHSTHVDLYILVLKMLIRSYIEHDFLCSNFIQNILNVFKGTPRLSWEARKPKGIK